MTSGPLASTAGSPPSRLPCSQPLRRRARTTARSSRSAAIEGCRRSSSPRMHPRGQRSSPSTRTPATTGGRGSSRGSPSRRRRTESAFERNLVAAGVRHRVRHVAAGSSDAHGSVAGEIDVLFIDGAHRYAAARADLHDWGRRVSSGGTMLVHDAFSSVGVTAAIMRELVFGRRYRYVGRSRSLAEYRADLAAAGTAARGTQCRCPARPARMVRPQSRCQTAVDDGRRQGAASVRPAGARMAVLKCVRRLLMTGAEPPDDRGPARRRRRRFSTTPPGRCTNSSGSPTSDRRDRATAS